MLQLNEIEVEYVSLKNSLLGKWITTNYLKRLQAVLVVLSMIKCRF